MTAPPRGHLRLVSSTALESVVRGHVSVGELTVQQALFPTGIESLAVFVAFEELTDKELLRLLDAVHPSYAIDLRFLPRFDTGVLNRKVVFAEFEERNIQYRDLSSFLRNTYTSARQIEPARVAVAVRDYIGKADIAGPIVFFVNTDLANGTIPYELIQSFGAKRSWDICFFPAWHATLATNAQYAADKPNRSVLFISHANPEDNEFATWLHAKLMGLGFEVWADVTALRTGEVIWDAIEDVIRHKAVRFIAVLSRASQQKAGCLDEINLAVNVERSLGLANFVLPIRIDDLPFTEIRANLARKNVGDFCGSWAYGLQQLVAGFDRDKVPRDAGQGVTDLLKSWRVQRSAASSVIHEPEALSSNWLPIEAVPQTVHAYQAVTTEPGARAVAPPFPHRSHGNALFAFVATQNRDPTSDLQKHVILRAEIATAEFVRGNPGGLYKLAPLTARNILSDLLRQHWEHYVRNQGLLRYELSGRRICYFFPSTTEATSYVDNSGTRRRRTLTGRSERRQVYWHLGLEANVALTHPRRVALVLHVIFTKDGVTPLESKAHMHRLRRSFCKSWWNDRWRDLLFAALHRLSSGAAAVSLLSPPNELRIGFAPMVFSSPVHIREAANDEPEMAADLPFDIDEHDADVIDDDMEEDFDIEGDDV